MAATAGKTGARSRGGGGGSNGTKLEKGLLVFKSDKFDADAFLHTKCSLNDQVSVLFLFDLLIQSFLLLVMLSFNFPINNSYLWVL